MLLFEKKKGEKNSGFGVSSHRFVLPFRGLAMSPGQLNCISAGLMSRRPLVRTVAGPTLIVFKKEGERAASVKTSVNS